MKYVICVCCYLSLLLVFSVAGRNMPFKAEGNEHGWRSTPVNGGKPELQGHTKAVDDEGGGGIVTTSSSVKTECMIDAKSMKEASNCACAGGAADCRTSPTGGAANYDPNYRVGEHTLWGRYYSNGKYVAPQVP